MKDKKLRQTEAEKEGQRDLTDRTEKKGQRAQADRTENEVHRAETKRGTDYNHALILLIIQNSLL